MKSIFTTVKCPKKGLVLASSLSRVWIGPKVFVPRVGKRSDRLINRAWNPVGVLDQSLLFCISPANPIILEVTKGTTKIDDPNIRPKGGIPINSNHPFGMPLSIPSGWFWCLAGQLKRHGHSQPSTMKYDSGPWQGLECLIFSPLLLLILNWIFVNGQVLLQRESARCLVKGGYRPSNM